MVVKTFTSVEVIAELPAIFNVFAGMDDEYVKLIRAHHDVIQSRKYNEDYIKQHHRDTVNKLGEIVEARKVKARDVIEGIRKKFSEPSDNKIDPGLAAIYKKYGISEDEPATGPNKVQAETTRQLQRSNNLALWAVQLPYATAAELSELYAVHKDDPDFVTLLNVEFRKRPTEGSLSILKHKIENPPVDKRFEELDRIEKGIAFVKGDSYAANMASGLSGWNFRNVHSDLNAVPVGTHTPSFKLPAFN